MACAWRVHGVCAWRVHGVCMACAPRGQRVCIACSTCMARARHAHLVCLPAEQLDIHSARAAPPFAPCACVPVSGVAAGRRSAGQDRVALVRSAVGAEVSTLAAFTARLVTVTRLARAAPPPPRARVARLAAIRAARRPLGAAGGRRRLLECGGGGRVEELVISDDLARGAVSVEDDGAHLAPPLHLPLPVLQR